MKRTIFLILLLDQLKLKKKSLISKVLHKKEMMNKKQNIKILKKIKKW